MDMKDKVKNNPAKYKWLFSVYNHVCGRNKIVIKGKSKVVIGAAMLKQVRIRVDGEDNLIEIGNLTRMNRVEIFVKGSNNVIRIGENNGFEESSLWIEDDNNLIQIGEHNRFFRNSHLAALEGTAIRIGSDGLFAPGVEMRTSDSHSILNMGGIRLNKAKDISVGNHVWAAVGTVFLKGAVVPDNSIVGMHSMVNKLLDEKNCLYVGNPVRKVKSGVTWVPERVQGRL